MELETEALCGASHGERSETDQPAQRLPRSRLAHARRHGRVADPEAAQGQLLPGFLEPWRMAEKALTAVIQ